EIGRQEGKRDRHVDLPNAAPLALGDAFRICVRVGKKFVESSALSMPRSRRIPPPMTEQPAAGAPQASTADPNAEGPRCLKPQALCVCEGIARIDNKVSLLILQHPQEQDRQLGTARLTALHFKDALLKIGLSWPSLTKILGRPTDPQRWAILYLGS